MNEAALCRLPIHGDEAAGLLDDAIDGGQPQTRALAHRLGGEEGIEDLALNLLGHADAGVGDFDADISPGGMMAVPSAVEWPTASFTVLMVTAPPDGMASRALTTRLMRALESWASSAWTGPKVGRRFSTFSEMPSPTRRAASAPVRRSHRSAPAALGCMVCLRLKASKLAHQGGGAQPRSDEPR